MVNPKAKSFRELAKALPDDRILTETGILLIYHILFVVNIPLDSPYMAPDKSTVNDPSTVVQSIETFAQLRGCSVEKMRTTVRSNFRDLFGL